MRCRCFPPTLVLLIRIIIVIIIIIIIIIIVIVIIVRRSSFIITRRRSHDADRRALHAAASVAARSFRTLMIALAFRLFVFVFVFRSMQASICSCVDRSICLCRSVLFVSLVDEIDFDCFIFVYVV
jgi:hypothetical protein